MRPLEVLIPLTLGQELVDRLLEPGLHLGKAIIYL